MRIRYIPAAVLVVVSLVGAAASAPGKPAAAAANGVPDIKNMSYKPEPAITAIPATPDPEAVPKPNPTGEYNAYDLNVFETIWFPERQPGDEDAKAEPGGAVDHGTCPEGGCENHALEFKKFWKKLMRPLVKPFGGAVHSYKFFSPGSGTPDGAPLNSPPGDTFNLQATIPGAVHPEQMVIVSGHYDQTDSGPGSAWDSAEGHATVFRIAKIMTDYWRKTGTRPAVSVKFTAWSAEEAGTFGSEAYVRDNVLPFPNLKVRGYFNLDPCGGAYPAYYRGNPGVDRIPMVMQLANPAQAISPDAQKAMTDFNEQAREVVGDVFNHLDDKLTDVPTEPEIFVSDEEADEMGIPTQETEIVTAVGGLKFFTSDYRNFEQIGVPILNIFPDVFGPHADNTPGRNDGLAILHTPNDNLKTLNALTGLDQSGLTPSQGWYKGLELCAHLHGWFMLQQNMGGAVARNTDVVPYFEGIAKEAAPIKAGTAIKFDANGSYAYSNPAKLTRVRKDKITYRWNFGDGSKAKGKNETHKFKKAGTYKVTLTMTAAGKKATHSLLVNIE